MTESFDTPEGVLRDVEDTRNQLEALQARMETLSGRVGSGELRLEDIDVQVLAEWLSEIEWIARDCAASAAKTLHVLGTST